MANPGVDAFYRTRAEFDGLNAQLELQLESFVAYARARRDELLEAFEKEAVHIDDEMLAAASAAVAPVAFPEVSPFVIVNREMEALARFQRTSYSAENLQAAIAAKSKSLASVELSLLKTDNVSDPSALDNLAFRVACQNKHIEIIRLLLADPRVDPAAVDNMAFRMACKNKHIEIIRLLLADPRVDPAAPDNKAILYASSHEHIEVIRLLLADPRVDPTTGDNEAIFFACSHGNTEVVSLLLADPRVDPAARDNEAIRMACQNKHIEVIRILLADPRVDPAARDNKAILFASYHEHIDVMRLLLADPRVDPAARNNTALRRAFLIEQTDVVQILLTRASPETKDKFAFWMACRNGKLDVVRTLIPSVDAAERDFALKVAEHFKQPKVVKFLKASIVTSNATISRVGGKRTTRKRTTRKNRNARI